MIKLNVHPYPNTVWFTNDAEKYRAKWMLMSGQDRGIDSGGMCSYTADGRNLLIGVFDGCNSTVVHELSHATFAIMEYIEQPIDFHHSEAYCYLIESMYSQCEKWLAKQK